MSVGPEGRKLGLRERTAAKFRVSKKKKNLPYFELEFCNPPPHHQSD